MKVYQVYNVDKNAPQGYVIDNNIFSTEEKAVLYARKLCEIRQMCNAFPDCKYLGARKHAQYDEDAATGDTFVVAVEVDALNI